MGDLRKRARMLSVEQPVSNSSVWMHHPDLGRAPQVALPEGYRMRPYAAGDVATWVRVQQAAERLVPVTAETFARFMPGDEAHLARRVLFLVDPAGAAIGTITAWNDDQLTGRDIGLLHWVAIIPAAQGRSLSKPMLSRALAVLQAHGYTEAYLETGSARIPALNLYLGFGFVPYVRAEADRAAWQAVAPHLKTPIRV